MAGKVSRVVGDTASYPPYAQVVTTGNVSYVWDTAPTDVRALQRAVGNGRVAATWVADTTFDIDVNVTDGQVHQVAIYCMDWDSTERVQRIDVLNAVTGAVLDTRTIKAFSGGQYLVWNVSGGVTLRVTRIAGANGIVEGIFFGTANSTSAMLTTPSNGAAYVAPANVVLNATASTTSGTISKVEFFQGATKLGEDLTSPYSLTWPSVPAGTYTLTAKATNSAGGTATSDPVQILVAAGSAAASFVRSDTTTKGNWRGTYGGDGFSVVGDTTSYPAYVQVVPSGHFTWVWETATSDVRALQRSVGSGRVAAAWNASTPFNVGVNVMDGQFHQLAIYCVDWDSTERVQRVDILNSVTGAVLDTRTVGAFNGGQWLVWNVTGGITLRVTTVAGVNGVIQGIFFGGTPNATPSVTLTGPASGASFTAPATVPLTATATDTDGTIALVEFFQGTTKIGEDTTAPYSFSWTNAPAGPYSLTAKATDNAGGTTTSAAVGITVNPPANVPPTVSITAPANGATFTAPASVSITANAGDTDGTVSLVEFFQGTTKIGQDTTAPYSFSWTQCRAGPYSLTAQATDNSGGITTSAAVGITVNPPANVPPTASITAPANGATFTAPASVSITATAGDTDGTVRLVEFFQGTTKIGQDTTAPYSFTWSNVAAGAYNLTARATDNSGGITTSAVVGDHREPAGQRAANGQHHRTGQRRHLHCTGERVDHREGRRHRWHRQSRRVLPGHDKDRAGHDGALQLLVEQRRGGRLQPDRTRHRQLGRHHHLGGRRDHSEPAGQRAADRQHHRTGQRRHLHCTGERVDHGQCRRHRWHGESRRVLPGHDEDWAGHDGALQLLVEQCLGGRLQPDRTRHRQLGRHHHLGGRRRSR